MDLRPALIALCGGVAILLQAPIGEANAARRVVSFDYVPDTAFAKVVAVGHHSTAANLIWLSSLPDMSRQVQGEEMVTRKKTWLNGVLDTVTDLEPSFQTAYIYGSDYLYLANKDYDNSIRVLEKGVRLNPRSFNLRVKLGMAHFGRGDKTTALEVLEKAIQLPGADDMTKSMVAAMRVRGGDDRAALLIFQPVLENPNTPELIRQVTLRDYETAKKLIVIRARDTFEERHGRLPTSLDELREPGLMDPVVHDAVLDPKCVIVNPDGTLQFPALAELDLAHTLRAANHWRNLYYNEHGRFPTLTEILENEVMPLGDPPAGRRWALGPKGLVLEDVDASGGE